MTRSVAIRMAADLLAAFHAALVLFAIFGLVVTLLGIWRRWSLARNFWFRTAHLVYCAIVALLAVCGIPCPLTVWEVRLRRLAGDVAYPGSFVGTWIRRCLYVDVPEEVLTAAYVVFAILVLLTWVCWPPAWPRRHRPTRN